MFWFRLGLAALVTLVWLAGYVLAFVNHDPLPGELSGLMALVLGWALGGATLEVIRNTRASKRLEEGEEADAA